MSFIQQLNAAVEALREREGVELLYYKVLPPVPGIVERAETWLGHALHPTIAQFYQECGGV